MQSLLKSANKKRRRSFGEPCAVNPATVQARKRPRIGNSDGLSRFSDEILIKILAFLDASDLVQSQRVSRRFDTLARDPHLWKALYYDHFVRPRAARIPGISSSYLGLASRKSNWLDDRHLVSEHANTDWKAQYRLRRNWTRGSPRTSGFFLSGHIPPTLPLIRMQGDHAVAVDPAHGLRAWHIKGRATVIAGEPLSGRRAGAETQQALPTSLALDSQYTGEWIIRAAVGFDDGSWSLHMLDASRSDFAQLHHQPRSTHGAIIAMAFAYPYIATLNLDRRFCVYSIAKTGTGSANTSPQTELLCSLSSHCVKGPLSLSLRILSVGVMACIAFAAPSYSAGWNIGVQEVLIGFDGEIKDSRVALATTERTAKRKSFQEDKADLPSWAFFQQIGAETLKPTSLSYAHPYLLVAYPNNTLAVHLVRSSDSQLSLSSGHSLWGHTSSVSDAQVGARGKAVSASVYGDEIRVWDLEGLLTSKKQEPALIEGMSLQPQLNASLERGQHTQPGFDVHRDHRVVGFDTEKIVTMREQNERALIIYDFS